MTNTKGRTPDSDRPPEDLKKERDAFIQQFFRKGAQLTEELLKEGERLRDRIASLEAENGELRTHLASDEAIRDLLRKIESLEKEKQELLARSRRAQESEDGTAQLYAEIEGELANFANLYVAASQLLGARSVRGVLRNLKELLAQLVGAAAFVVYLRDDEHAELVAIATEGARAADVARIPAGAGPIGQAVAKGQIAYQTTGDLTRGTLDAPAAVIPLSLEGATVGAIVIVATLPQKTEFVNIDVELFRLLGAQAAAALANARFFTEAGRKLPTVGAFLDLED
ncbi:MAG TPA: GAF domain-containing protein [Byssovorax sp.]|jgi:putative methionine-R-sulfoxide reductase with GAF domain